MSLKVRQRSAPETCPLCRDELKDETPVSTCEGCGTTFHAECGSEFGGCPTTGCKVTPERRPEVLPLRERRRQHNRQRLARPPVETQEPVRPPPQETVFRPPARTKDQKRGRPRPPWVWSFPPWTWNLKRNPYFTAFIGLFGIVGCAYLGWIKAEPSIFFLGLLIGGLNVAIAIWEFRGSSGDS